MASSGSVWTVQSGGWTNVASLSSGWDSWTAFRIVSGSVILTETGLMLNSESSGVYFLDFRSHVCTSEQGYCNHSIPARTLIACISV